VSDHIVVPYVVFVERRERLNRIAEALEPRNDGDVAGRHPVPAVMRVVYSTELRPEQAVSTAVDETRVLRGPRAVDRE
jgi:hypothetical protein